MVCPECGAALKPRQLYCPGCARLMSMDGLPAVEVVPLALGKRMALFGPYLLLLLVPLFGLGALVSSIRGSWDQILVTIVIHLLMTFLLTWGFGMGVMNYYPLEHRRRDLQGGAHQVTVRLLRRAVIYQKRPGSQPIDERTMDWSGGIQFQYKRSGRKVDVYEFEWVGGLTLPLHTLGRLRPGHYYTILYAPASRLLLDLEAVDATELHAQGLYGLRRRDS